MKVSIIFGEYCGENEPNLQRPLTYPKLQEACAKVLEEGSATEEIPTRGWVVVFQSSFFVSYFVGCATAPKFYETRAKSAFAAAAVSSGQKTASLMEFVRCLRLQWCGW